MCDTPRLTWALAVATKDRFEPLQTCIEMALAQTRPPTEIIVVDASTDWEIYRREIGARVAEFPEIRFVYDKAELPSLTVQRNQAAAHASGDVLFMIDDDSFMYPDCAAEIMAIYEADIDRSVVGVQANEMPSAPAGRVRQEDLGKRKVTHNRSGRLGRLGLMRWVKRKVFMMAMDEVFIPYDKSFPEYSVPESLGEQAVSPAKMFGGFRMTFRRTAVLQEPFDPTLRYYCPGEDLDGSYRISRHGMLLSAEKAKLYHHAALAGRLRRGQVAHLWSLNQAVLLRRHASDQNWAKHAYRRKMWRRIVSDILKDLLKTRLRFDQTRGSLRALRESDQVFSMSLDQIDDWYPARQGEIIQT